MYKKTKFSNILIFIPLFFGGIIYILFRTESLLMFKWFRFLNLENHIFSTRKIFKIELPDWFVYNLPDGLWIFSYSLLMLSIWNFKLNIHSVFWIFLMPFIAIISEILQFFKIIPGTYDIWDLNFYILGTLLPLILNRKLIDNLNTKNYEQKI